MTQQETIGKFKEVRMDFVNEETNRVSIDAWTSDNAEEEGRVLGEFDLNDRKVYWREDTTAIERADPLVMMTLIEYTSNN